MWLERIQHYLFPGDVEKVGLPEQAHIHGRWRRRESHLERAFRPKAEAQTARQTVAGPARYNPHRRPGGTSRDDRAGRLVHGSIAAPDDDAIAAGVEKQFREFRRVTATFCDPDLRYETKSCADGTRELGAACTGVTRASGTTGHRIDHYAHTHLIGV